MKKVFLCLMMAVAFMACNGDEPKNPTGEKQYVSTDVQFVVESTPIVSELAKVNVRYFLSKDTSLMAEPAECQVYNVVAGREWSSQVFNAPNFVSGYKVDVAVDSVYIASLAANPMAAIALVGRVVDPTNGLYFKIKMITVDHYSDGSTRELTISTGAADARGMSLDLSQLTDINSTLDQLFSQSQYVARNINGDVRALRGFAWK